jgi:hypothetical protein
MGYCGAINVSLPAAHINSHIWSEMKKKETTTTTEKPFCQTIRIKKKK